MKTQKTKTKKISCSNKLGKQNIIRKQEKLKLGKLGILLKYEFIRKTKTRKIRKIKH